MSLWFFASEGRLFVIGHETKFDESKLSSIHKAATRNFQLCSLWGPLWTKVA